MPNIIDVIDFTPIISSLSTVALSILTLAVTIRYFYILIKVFKSWFKIKINIVEYMFLCIQFCL